MLALKAKATVVVILLIFQSGAAPQPKAPSDISAEYASAKVEWDRCLSRIKFGDLAVVDCNTTVLDSYRSLTDKVFARAIASQDSKEREALRRLRTRWSREEARHCFANDKGPPLGTLELVERTFCQVEEAEKRLARLLKT